MNELPREIIVEIGIQHFETYFSLRKTSKWLREIIARKEIYQKMLKRNVVYVERDGVKKSYLMDKLHSVEDEPAIIKQDIKKWYKFGFLHRRNGPALIEYDKSIWYYCGILHREDGPAFKDYCTKKWYKYGLLHRDNKPAWYNTKGEFRIWSKFGNLYRGKESEPKWQINQKIRKEKYPTKTDQHGNKWWFKNGKPFRENGGPVSIFQMRRGVFSSA